MGIDWRTRLESCRNAIESLEHAENEVGRAYRLEDPILLMQAERDWNERRVEVMKRIRDTFAALEDAHALSVEILERKMDEWRPKPLPVVYVARPMTRDMIIIAALSLGIGWFSFFIVMALT